MTVPSLTRTSVAVSLVLGALLTALSILTMPDFTGDNAASLQAIADSSVATLSSLSWIASQLFLAVGTLGVMHLLRHRVPVLATLAGGLLLVGVFGHTVHGGVQLMMLQMARDPGAVQAHAATLDGLYSHPAALPFLAAGLLGVVLGHLVLAAAVWRAGTGPRWLAPALVLFVLSEFLLNGLAPWVGSAAGVLFVLAYVSLAVVVRRSSIAHWETTADASARPDDDAARGLVVQAAGVGVHDEGRDEEAQQQGPQR